jgi:large repetitive protein
LLKAPAINPRRTDAIDDLAQDSNGDWLDSAPLFGSAPTDAAHTSRVTGQASTANLLVDDTADHIINATESAAVAFTVSGLARGETGIVTFTDASNRHVVVGVDGNGTYSANLSTLTDGRITSSLSTADGAGNRATATGNAVSLDTDSTLTPTLLVDATNPSHVTFTVSGLEGDETGTVTFTDSSNRQDVVAIGSNGAYSANLSNLADGTISYLLQVTDPAGNVTTVDPPLNLGDGSVNGPGGSAQLPTLLKSYAVRPSWNVAGVDYADGITPGTVLKDPFAGGVLASALVALGGSANTSNHVITFSGVNNAVINGWDFSLEGGWTVLINSNNATIENSNFKVGTNLRTPIIVSNSANNVTIQNNVIDGAGLNNGIGWGLIEGNAYGTTTIQYNWIKNAFSEDIVLGTSPNGPASQNIQYNLIENAGMGFNQGAHGDWIQVVASPRQTISDLELNFNTWIQDLPDTVARTQGLSLLSANMAQGSVLKEGISNNTFVAPGPSINQVNYFVIVDTTFLNGSATVGNNYYNPTGINGSFLWAGNYNAGGVGVGPYNGTVNTLNNYNMVNGKILR